MPKFIDSEQLKNLANGLNSHISNKVVNEKTRAMEVENNLVTEISRVEGMFGGKSLVYITGAEYELLTNAEKNDDTKIYFIIDEVDLSHTHENKELLDNIAEALAAKANAGDLTGHIGDAGAHITADERTNWNAKSNLALGTSNSTAFRGDQGLVAYNHSQATHAPTTAATASEMGLMSKEDKAKLDGINEILDWEGSNVVNTKYKHGDIRRYGALCDGVTDDSDALQLALDICGPNDIYVYIPEGLKTVIRKPIVLRSNIDPSTGWSYKIKSNQSKTNTICLYQECENLFVGENFYNEVPTFTSVKIIMDNVSIRCIDSNVNIKPVVFKAIDLYSSYISNCKFYFPYVLIEGSITTGTKFTRNRVQGFYYAVVSSISRINGSYDFDYINQVFVESDYNIESLNELLVKIKPDATDYQKFNKQSNDCYFDHNYIAGKTNQVKLPKAIFSVETIDSDFIVESNWFEFCKYVISPNIRVSANIQQGNIYGCNFINNVFQLFFRFFNPESRYSKFILNGNSFYSFSKDKLLQTFSNTNDADIISNNFKCGVIVADYNEPFNTGITSLILSNNRFENNDYSIYYDNGNNGRSFRFSCKETNSIFTNNVNSPFIRLRHVKDSFTNSKFDCFNNIDLENVNIESLSYTNMFAGQIVNNNGKLYISEWKDEKPELIPMFVEEIDKAVIDEILLDVFDITIEQEEE